MSIFIIMEMKDLIRQLLREETFDYTPEIGRVDVSGDFSGKITNLMSALGITGGLKEKLLAAHRGGIGVVG